MTAYRIQYDNSAHNVCKVCHDQIMVTVIYIASNVYHLAVLGTRYFLKIYFIFKYYMCVHASACAYRGQKRASYLLD